MLADVVRRASLSAGARAITGPQARFDLCGLSRPACFGVKCTVNRLQSSVPRPDRRSCTENSVQRVWRSSLTRWIVLADEFRRASPPSPTASTRSSGRSGPIAASPSSPGRAHGATHRGAPRAPVGDVQSGVTGEGSVAGTPKPRAGEEDPLALLPPQTDQSGARDKCQSWCSCPEFYRRRGPRPRWTELSAGHRVDSITCRSLPGCRAAGPASCYASRASAQLFSWMKF
jgi:hypothetical protein